MIVEIVSTGEEVLSGQIHDTNATFLSELLSQNSVEVSRRLTIGDRLDDLVETFQERSKVADIILVTGGLGPTSDDLSASAMAQATGEPLRFFPEWWEELERRFAKYNRTLDPQNKKQATLPQSATILDNPIGTACGFKIKLNRATFYFMPGVPSEMKKMFQEIVLPEILLLDEKRTEISVDVFQTFGWAESRLGRELSQIELPPSISLGYRPRMPTVEIKMIARDATAIEKQNAASEIRKVLGDAIYSESAQSLAMRVHELMLATNKSLATAESCTGGLLSAAIVDNAGSSSYFERGYVTYSNTAKVDCLLIKPEIIETHGAVSEEVATAMATQAKLLGKTDYALSVTGVAGPDGGSLDKPVGTVVFALATNEQTYVQRLALPAWGRQRVREISTAIALDMLRRELLGMNVLSDYDFAPRAASSKNGPLA